MGPSMKLPSSRLPATEALLFALCAAGWVSLTAVSYAQGKPASAAPSSAPAIASTAVEGCGGPVAQIEEAVLVIGPGGAAEPW